ncbi:MAG: hypothetical protein ACK4TG_03555 [Thermaurantiacus sp.]
MAYLRLPAPNQPSFRRVCAWVTVLVALLLLVACGEAQESPAPPDPDGAPGVAEPAPDRDAGAQVPTAPDEQPAADALLPCAASGGTMLTRGQCDAVAGIRAAKGSYNAPEEMVRGERFRIRFALSRTGDAAATERAVGQLPGETVTIDTRASASMRATLSGQAFEIDALSPERQDLSARTTASWEWDVTPTRAGSQILTLRTFAEIPDGERFLIADEQIEDRLIRVVVTPGDEVEDWLDASERWIRRGNNWIVALTALLAAVAGLVAAVRALVSRRGSSAD